MAIAANQPRPVARADEHRFFLLMTIAMSATVFVGFSRSFFLRPLFPEWPSPHEPFFYLHGAVFTLWFVLLVTQAALIGAGRVAAHRALGRFGAVVAAAMVVLGIVGGIIAAKRPAGFIDVPIPGPQFLIVPVLDMLSFGTLVGFAIARRHDAQAHKRLMLVASMITLAAAIARWPGVHGAGVIVYFLCNDLFLIPLIIWDRRTLGRIHPATWWGGGWLLLSQPLRLVLAGTPAWLAAANWLTGLV